jgi:hypothetical protein
MRAGRRAYGRNPMDGIVAHRDFNLGAQPERNGPRERDPPAGVVADRDDLLKPQGVRDYFQITELLFEGVNGALRLV